MSHESEVTANPRAALFDVMDGVRVGMLGLKAGSAGAQPMTHFLDVETEVIWFISSKDTDLVRDLGLGGQSEYVIISKDHDVHASLQGILSHVQDAGKLDQLWSPMVSAWFKDGRSDPRIALLQFKPKVAEIWASTTSAVRFGLEMVRANLTDHEPNVGTHQVIRFDPAV